MTKKDYIKLAELLTKHRTMANLRQGATFVIKKGEFMIDLCNYLKKDKKVPSLLPMSTTISSFERSAIICSLIALDRKWLTIVGFSEDL